MFTPANVDDKFPLKQKKFHDKLFGKIFGDGIHLITKVPKNM